MSARSSRGSLVNRLLEIFRAQETDTLYLYWGKRILVAALIFAAFWLLSRFVSYFLTVWGPKFTSFTATDLDDRILSRITPPTSLLVVFAGIYLAVKSLPLAEKAHATGAGIAFILTMAILTNIIYRTIDETLV